MHSLIFSLPLRYYNMLLHASIVSSLQILDVYTSQNTTDSVHSLFLRICSSTGSPITGIRTPMASHPTCSWATNLKITVSLAMEENTKSLVIFCGQY